MIVKRSRDATSATRGARDVTDALKQSVLDGLRASNARVPRELVHDVLQAMAGVARLDLELARTLRVLAVDIKEGKI